MLQPQSVAAGSKSTDTARQEYHYADNAKKAVSFRQMPCSRRHVVLEYSRVISDGLPPEAVSPGRIHEAQQHAKMFADAMARARLRKHTHFSYRSDLHRVAVTGNRAAACRDTMVLIQHASAASPTFFFVDGTITIAPRKKYPCYFTQCFF